MVAQTLIYGRIGFTRILGSTHNLWVPMFVWMATRIDTIRAEPALADWLLLLFVRFLHGERAPHYRWKQA